MKKLTGLALVVALSLAVGAHAFQERPRANSAPARVGNEGGSILDQIERAIDAVDPPPQGRAGPPPGTPAPCNPGQSPNLVSNNSLTRIPAVRACLDALASDINFSRKGRRITKLITFGHPDKIKSMRSKTKQQSWDFTRAFQARREERRAIALLGAPSATVIASARRYHRENHDLEDLLAAYHAKANKTPADITAFKAAAYAKIYPDFLNHLANGFPALPRKNLTARQEGEKIGSLVGPGFDSTGGFGVYLALNAEEVINGHLEPGGDGLVCDIPGGSKFINTDDDRVLAALRWARIIVRDLSTSQGDAPILRPTGKNLLVSPQDFEEAMAGRYMLVFRASKNASKNLFLPYVADKGVLDFSSRSQSCRPISIAEYSTCDEFADLVGSGFYETQGMGGPFLELLHKRRNFVREFFAKWMACTASSRQRVCDDLINDDLQGKGMLNKAHVAKFLRRDNFSKFGQVLTACNCNPRGKKGNLTFNCPTSIRKARQ